MITVTKLRFLAGRGEFRRQVVRLGPQSCRFFEERRSIGFIVGTRGTVRGLRGGRRVVVSLRAARGRVSVP